MKRKAMYATFLTIIFAFSLLSGAIVIGAFTHRSMDITDFDFTEITTTDLTVLTTGDGIVNKYALIIGISDYSIISDLSYCDEDASDWFNYLDPLGYQITLLGDSHLDTYPQWDGYATEYNVKMAFAEILAVADEDDIIVFASSGHGGRYKDTTIKSFLYFLCMWDTSAGENGENGLITQFELKDMVAPSLAKTFVFLDHCYAGGFGNMFENDNSANFYLATTCTDNGFGWDDPEHQNGKWTYFFLEYALIEQLGGTGSMEEAFEIALPPYLLEVHRPGDTPMEFDGDLETLFYL